MQAVAVYKGTLPLVPISEDCRGGGHRASQVLIILLFVALNIMLLVNDCLFICKSFNRLSVFNALLVVNAAPLVELDKEGRDREHSDGEQSISHVHGIA